MKSADGKHRPLDWRQLHLRIFNKLILLLKNSRDHRSNACNAKQLDLTAEMPQTQPDRPNAARANPDACNHPEKISEKQYDMSERSIHP